MRASCHGSEVAKQNVSPEAKAKAAERLREWRRQNPEKRKAQTKRAGPKARERIRSNPDSRAKQAEAIRKSHQKTREAIVAWLGGCCVSCGYSDPRALHIDHVRSNGGEERQMRGKGYIQRIRDNLESGDYQLLCGNCNEIKRLATELRASKEPRPRVRPALTDPKKLAERARNQAAWQKRRANPELLAEKQRNDKISRDRIRRAAQNALGGKCVHCGHEDMRVLHVDHVHGGGNAHRATVTPAALYREILADPTSGKYQLLCCCCNLVKKIVNGETTRGQPRKPRPPEQPSGPHSPSSEDQKPANVAWSSS